MGITQNARLVDVGGHEVSVTGRTGPVHATWTLLVDGQRADTARAAGDFSLRADLPDGSRVHAAVHQSLLGPAEVTIHHDGIEVARHRGLVA